METNRIIEILKIVCQNLNCTDVRGKQNLINIAGSIAALEEIIVNLTKTEEK